MKTSEPPRSQPRPRWKQWLIDNLDLYSQNQTELLDDLQRANDKKILDEHAVDMIQGILAFDSLKVHDIMIPRSRINFLRHTDDFSTVLERIAETEHSRYPVFNEDRDQLVGVLLAKDLLKYIGHEQDFVLADAIRPALIVPETQPLNRLLTEFRDNRSHMAVVVDEYAAVAGLVTFEDVLEQIIGDIDDEHDDEKSEVLIKSIGDQHFLVNATTPIEDFNETFATDFPDDEFDTIAGLIINELGKIPREGEELELEGWLFRVSQCDSRRILQLEVQQAANQNNYANAVGV
ncbi:HlyC/CorC family transporter [Thiolinea disciformis]|uniref:HlyC/CorC family transporter n=1 Tax=Thiolinea disciformis TaxID=125614 RepID=UPI000374A67B|nr:transporter associated domain-containing protein [Thiolinea disciformis]